MERQGLHSSSRSSIPRAECGLWSLVVAHLLYMLIPLRTTVWEPSLHTEMFPLQLVPHCIHHSLQ